VCLLEMYLREPPNASSRLRSMFITATEGMWTPVPLLQYMWFTKYTFTSPPLLSPFSLNEHGEGQKEIQNQRRTAHRCISEENQLLLKNQTNEI
jgi:hypothetical protein